MRVRLAEAEAANQDLLCSFAERKITISVDVNARLFERKWRRDTHWRLSPLITILFHDVRFRGVIN